MRSRRKAGLALLIYASLLVSLPAASKDEASNPNFGDFQGLRSKVQDLGFQNEVCSGVKNSEFSVAQLMVAGQYRIRSNQSPHVVIGETFEAKGASSSTERLAATIAAGAIAAMVREEQIDKPLSINEAEILCLAVLMKYGSYLKRDPYALASEVELVIVAGAAFDDVFNLMRRAEILSGNGKNNPFAVN
jgi:hypothetical protein